jgi:hypothetical protein
MKLLHNPTTFTVISAEVGDNALTYGYDTTQVTMIDGTVIDSVNKIASAIFSTASIKGRIDSIDTDFANTFDFYLALEPPYFNGWTSDPTYKPNGRVDAQDYKDKSGYAAGWYGNFATALQGMASDNTYGGRIVGVRWNHEYNLAMWTRGAAWEAWCAADPTASSLLDYVNSNKLTEWNRIMASIAGGALNAWEFTRTSMVQPPPWWNDPYTYGSVQALTKYLATYQLKIQGSIINLLASTIKKVSDTVQQNLKLVLYPANNGPSSGVNAPMEYSMDWAWVDNAHGNVVWEFSSWATSAWSQAALYDYSQYATGAVRGSFFWTMQYYTATDVEVPSSVYDNGSAWTKWRLEATNSLGQGAWNSSFGLWARFTGNEYDAMTNPKKTMASYFKNVKKALTGA